MLRSLVGSAIKGVSSVSRIVPATSLRSPHFGISVHKCLFSSMQISPVHCALPQLLNTNNTTTASGILQLPVTLQTQQSRSVTKFSLNKGKRKTVKAVLKRFRRLDWGAWIRTYTGRQKKLFKKSSARKRRLRQHVFTNATQSFLLDKMVTSFWRRPKNWIDDVYAPYHRRDEFFATKTKTFKV